MLTALEEPSLALYQVARGERRVRESSVAGSSRQVG
jgi:hypothetical protein